MALQKDIAPFDQTLAKFQVENCAKGCRFAEQSKIGIGKPCCTFAFALDVQNGICKTRR